MIKMIETKNENQTKQLAKAVLPMLKKGDTILLYGEMGSGKTVFCRGLAEAMGYTEPVNSPTFTYLNIYNTSPVLYHFDLYRLVSEYELDDLDFWDYIESDGITLIEWPDRLGSFLDNFIKSAIKIEFFRDYNEDNNTRHINISVNNKNINHLITGENNA